jgi:hypothetical protein
MRVRVTTAPAPAFLHQLFRALAAIQTLFEQHLHLDKACRGLSSDRPFIDRSGCGTVKLRFPCLARRESACLKQNLAETVPLD